MSFSLVRGSFQTALPGIDTGSLTHGCWGIAPKSGLVTLAGMESEAQQMDPADVLLDAEGIQERYACGRTKAYDIMSQSGFPGSVIPGMVRIPLVALRAWEQATALQGTVAEPKAAEPIFLAPPAARQAGRRPAKGVA
jgi:hypothetical protein